MKNVEYKKLNDFYESKRLLKGGPWLRTANGVIEVIDVYLFLFYSVCVFDELFYFIF